MYQPPTPFELVYPDKLGCTNVLLIENEMKDPTVLYDSANEATFPILYSSTSSKSSLLTLLRTKFTSIDRIALAFNSNLGTIKQFLDNLPFFSDESTENVTFIIDVIQEFQVKNIDYLACQTLNYPIWTNYYDTIANATGVIVGASNDKTGNIQYGGDWVLENTSETIEQLYCTESIQYYNYVLDVSFSTFATLLYGPIQVISDGTYLYTLSNLSNPNYLTRLNLDGTNIINTFASISGIIWHIITYGGFIYATNVMNGAIIQYSLTSNTVTNSNFTPSKTGYSGLIAITTDGNHFYVSYHSTGTPNTGSINKYNMLGGIVTANWLSVLNGPLYMLIHNGFFYVTISNESGIGAGTINKYNLDGTPAVPGAPIWVSGLTSPGVLNVYGPNMYVSNPYTDAVIEISLATGSILSTTFVSGFSDLTAMTIVGSRMFLANNTANTIYVANMPPLTSPSPVVCFKEGSLILTDKGYLPIEQLRKGALIHTLLHGFVPIDMIAKRTIYHAATNDRHKDQLYVCTNDAYNEVFEPLIITGCHCILIDEFSSEQQRKEVIAFGGRVFITDNQYRLPACLDPRAKVYDKAGNYTIYHIALENENYYMNYGIYANGLLVETCSKRFLKELSNMEII